MASPDDPAPTRPRPATIWDVAHAAGVSVGTVSKALNGRGQLRAETREAVRTTAARLGFRPNDLAQSLLRKRSFTIGLISTDRYGRFSIPVLEGIEDALEAARISVFLCSASDDPARERQHIDSLLAKRVDGIIVTGRRTDARTAIDLGGASVPVLYAFAQVADPAAPYLLPDDFGGASLAGEHLIGLGRTCIAHVTGPERFEAVRQRRDGLRQALEAHGLAWRRERVLSGSWSEAWGHAAVTKLLARRPGIDAIACGSDQIARGVVDALRERGVRVPDDVAIVGFDNWEIIAAATRPPLTTIDMNLKHLGREAGMRMLAMIDGDIAAGVVRLGCQLVVRESCGAARAGRVAS
ncbi:MAG: LacI family DNA-binding transcriptional regulator [Proteobacteria bacterium]|nr:LacI family DNA-binding transcriptional regulator [Pseudomonadota bacterium]